MTETVNLAAPTALEIAEQKVAKAAEALAKAQQELAALQSIASIVPGVTVTFDYGRGEKVRTLTGVVRAVKDSNFKIEVGEGFEADLLIVHVNAIKEIVGTADATVEADPFA